MIVQIMTSDLRQKTTALRQEHILQAAIRVFERHGYRGATIKQIAKEAGVSDGTIYNVYKNKEELLFAVLRGLLRGAEAKPSAVVKGTDFAEGFERLMGDRWKHMTPDTLSMMRIVLAEALTDRALAARYVESIISPAVEGLGALLSHVAVKNTFDPADFPILQRSVVGLFLGLALMKLLGDPLLDERMDDVPAVLHKLLRGGLLNQQDRGTAT
jgi:AcrR family transcriptional regulator